MNKSFFTVVLVTAALFCCAAQDPAPAKPSGVPLFDPNRVQVCSIPQNASSPKEEGLYSPSAACRQVNVNECHSKRLVPCGPCVTCLVYLGKGELCRYPYPTNTECQPDLVCYATGACGDLVR